MSLDRLIPTSDSSANQPVGSSVPDHLPDGFGETNNVIEFAQAAARIHSDHKPPPEVSDRRLSLERDQLLILFGIEYLAAVVTVSDDKSLIIGRVGSKGAPEPYYELLNVVPFGGYDCAVSRNHACLHRRAADTVVMIDLGSSNGTWLNGTRLTPNVEYPLNNGDHLQFALLTGFVYLPG